MRFRVTVNPLSGASKHSKQAEDVSIVKCAQEYWPVIQPDGSEGLARMPLTLTGVNSQGNVYPGPGEWSIAGERVRIYENADGGEALTTGKIASFPKTVYAEGRIKGTALLTLTLLPGGGVRKDNPATESLLVKEPRPLLSVEPKVIGVKGARAKLTVNADIPFDKGVLRILSGGDRIQLLQGDTEVTSYEFTSKTEFDVKPVKGSTLDGVEFQWELEGVEEKRSDKLTVVEGTLEIHDKGDVKIGSKQRVIHKAKSRAKVVVSCQPKEWAGELELESASQKVKLFTNPSGPDGENEKRRTAASATPATFYVQGLETSDALWDTGLKLHLVGLANAVDEVKITVIETFLEVSKPYTPTAPVGRDARVEDFGTGPSILAAPPAEVSGEVTLYAQHTQLRAARALVRINMKPKDAPCKLILRAVQEANRAILFPEANERHSMGEISSVDDIKRLEIPAGGIALAENARAGAGNAGRYGADGYVLWAEGRSAFHTPMVVQLDVEAVDDDCGKAKFHIAWAAIRVEVKRSDNQPFLGAIGVEITDVATADLAVPYRVPQTIPRPTHPNPARLLIPVPVGNYRVKITPQNIVEQKFRVTLTSPAELPVTAPGPPVDAKFVLDPPYRRIQFIGYRVRTGTYKGLDNPAALSLQQNTDAQTQAKAFAFSSVLDEVDAKIQAATDPGAPVLKTDLKGKNFDTVKSDPLLSLRVSITTGINLDQAYAKELEGVKKNIARREGAKMDIEKRCAVMVQAVKKAYDSTGFAADSRVLKVFMAPEFYFRGQQGAYAVESLHQIPTALSAETSNGKYKDWLFVFGSAIGYREKPEDPYEEITAAVVPNTAKTKVFVKSHDDLPGSLADTGWDFLVGNTAHAIEDKQDTFANGWHSFTFTLDGVVSYPASNARLAVWNGAKVDVTNASKTAVGRFRFKKTHAALNIQPGWVLKRGGARLAIVTATKVDDRNWDLEVTLKPRTSVTDGRAEVTAGRLSRDHSGTFTVASYVVRVDYLAGYLASKCSLSKQDCMNYGYSFFKLRVAGPMAATYDVVSGQPAGLSSSLLFDPAPVPAWKTGSTLTVSPDRCEVWAEESFKEVHLTIDFAGGRYPAEGWRFEQGTAKGIVLAVKNPVGTRRDVVLRMRVDQAPDATLNFKFITSSRSVEIFNVCFVQKGGAGTPASSEGTALKERMVEKETISSVDFSGPEYGTGDKFYDPLHHLIDFYDSQLRAVPREGAQTSYDSSADAGLENKPGTATTFNSKFGDERDSKVHSGRISERSASGLGGGSLFDMDGLSFGLEVCLDHSQQRLKKSTAGPVRVQLVPSCGMSIEDNAKHMVPNGFIFNVDGSSVVSEAQKANGADIPGTENAFVSTVPQYGQLFEADGKIVVHTPEDLT